MTLLRRGCKRLGPALPNRVIIKIPRSGHQKSSQLRRKPLYVRRRDRGFPERACFCERGGPFQKSLNRNIFFKKLQSLETSFPALTGFINLTQPASLLALATAVPPHVVVQKEVAALPRRSSPNATRLRSAGARLRNFGDQDAVCRASDGLVSLGARLARADRRLSRRRRRAFRSGDARRSRDGGPRGRNIDTIVTVSSTGIATPSLEARALTGWAFAAT